MAGLPGRINDEERARRLFEIDRLEQEGYSDSKISDELGLSIQVIQRSKKYLENLKKADITPEVLAEKRSELYLEYVEIAEEAKRQFELYKNPTQCKYCKGLGEINKIVNDILVIDEFGNIAKIVCEKCKGNGYFHYPKDANRFLETWSSIIEKKAKLYGLDNIKSDIIQFNQFNSNQYIPDMKISGKAKKVVDNLAKMLKDDHESSIKKITEV